MSAGTIRIGKSMGLALHACLLALALTLVGCKESPGTGQAGNASAASEPVSVEAIAAQAKGFSVGSTISAHTVYVFFDPQCPHCAELWQAAKPLKSQARFVWIPIALLNATSAAQGATILAAPDPVAAMDQHEATLKSSGGITAASNIDQQKAAVERNSELHRKYGFAAVPTIVAKQAQTGALVTHEGAMTTAALAQFLGLNAPGS